MHVPYKSVLGLVALGAAAFAVIHLRSADQPAAPAAALPVPVVTAQVQQHDEPIVLSGIGTVEALNTASIQSQVTGVLEEVDFTEGQTVKKGDVLAKIDPRLYQAALTQAQGQLARDTALHAQAKSDLARYQTLGKEDSIALQQVADQKFLVAQYAADMVTDQGMIDSDQTQLDYTTLRAPFRWRDWPPAGPDRKPAPTNEHDRHRDSDTGATDQRRVHAAERRYRLGPGGAGARNGSSDGL